MGKIRVEELAAQMGIGSKEVLFLLQSIGVDVKSPQAALDESTVLAILQGKTHAPKQLIVRDNQAKAVRPQKSALNRIKIIEKTGLSTPEKEPAAAEPEPPPRRRQLRAEGRRQDRSRTGAHGPSFPSSPRPKKRPSRPCRRKIVLPPRPTAPPRPAQPCRQALRPAPRDRQAHGPRFEPTHGTRPRAGPWDPRAARWVTLGLPSRSRRPGARPLGGPPRPGAPVGRGPGPRPERAVRPSARGRQGRGQEDGRGQARRAAQDHRRGRGRPARVRRDLQGRHLLDISLPLIEKTADGTDVAPEARPVSKSAIRRAAKETRAHDSGKVLEFKKPAPTGPVFFTEGVTVKELSEKLGVLSRDIQRLLMQRGIPGNCQPDPRCGDGGPDRQGGRRRGGRRVLRRGAWS